MNKLQDWSHRLAIIVVIWLFATGDRVMMANKIPDTISVWNWSHIIVGLAGLLVAVVLLQQCCSKGQWRIYFPFLIGDLKPIGRDLKGLTQGKLPRSGSSGLLTLIQGVSVLLLLWVGFTGLAWLFTQGSSSAMMWRSYHIDGSCALLIVLLLHMIGAISSVIDLVRDQ